MPVVGVVKGYETEGESDEEVDGDGNNEVEIEGNEVEGKIKLNKINK